MPARRVNRQANHGHLSLMVARRVSHQNEAQSLAIEERYLYSSETPTVKELASISWLSMHRDVLAFHRDDILLYFPQMRIVCF